jgi:hypothetical protein
MSKRVFTRRTFLGLGIGAAAWIAGPAYGWMGTKKVSPPALPYAAVLRIPKARRLRILQVTDLHFFAGEAFQHPGRNKVTWENVTALIEKTKPDLLIATGDLWPENKESKGEERMRWAIEHFESLNLPWAYTWGNHDQIPDYAVGHKAFANARNCLYRGAATDGNYVIDVVDRHDRWLWQLVCLNSKGAGLGPTQQQWLRSLAKDSAASGHVPPRIAFFHIPLKQYADIWEQGAASGIKGESVCKESEDGSTLPVFKNLGVRACFCGHDHANDYSGMADGVELVYGRATGVGGYGAAVLPKGGKLITVNCKSGRYDWMSILPDGTKWHPKPGERTDKTPVK